MMNFIEINRYESKTLKNKNKVSIENTREFRIETKFRNQK